MSTSNILGAVGAVVGFYFGGPQGAQWGWMIGSAVGGYVDPTQVQGPRLQDTRGQTSAVGGAIPRAWGTAPVPGNVIWQQPGVTEHRHTDDGKGSGTEQVTYTYTRSYAIMFHLGEIAGVLQIKRNGKIVYDVRDDDTLTQEWVAAGNDLVDAFRYRNWRRAENAKFINKCRIYTGTQTQEPDPTIEAYLGVGNAPAYRGRAYFVVTDDETQAGEIAQYEIVVAACGTVTTIEDGTPPTPFNFMAVSDASNQLYVSDTAMSWTESFGGVTGYSNVFTYGTKVVVCNPSSASISDDFMVTLSPLPGWPDANIGGVVVTASGRVYGLVADGSNATVYVADSIYGPWTSVPLGIGASSIAGDDDCVIVAGSAFYRVSTAGGDFGTATATGFTCEGVRYGDGMFLFCGGGAANTHRWSEDDGATLTSASLPATAGQFIDAARMPDGSWISIHKNGTTNTDLNICRSGDGKTGWAFVTTPLCKFEGNNSRIIAVSDGTVLAAAEDGVGFYPIVSVDDGATWTAHPHSYAFSAGRASGVAVFSEVQDGQAIPDAPGHYVDQYGNVSGPPGTIITPCSTTTVGEIVAAVCELSGLTSDEYDVSQLTDTLDGYVIARETDAASVIESLRPIGMFDPAEWDGKFRGIKRGGTAVGSINGDDLVERDGDAFERELVQEVELLRKVSVGYLETAANWAPNTQAWERRVGTINARGESVVEVAAVMGADQAATIAKRKGLTSWGEPEKQKFSLPYRLAKYTPTDILNYTDADAEVHPIRLMQIEDDSGVRYVESASNCAEAYSATATGVAPKGPTITEDSLRGPTFAVYMNLPSLRTQDNVPGISIAACGLLAGWQGASILLSADGGVSYQLLTTINVPATMGRLTANCTDSSEPISVYLSDGAVSSINDDQLALRQNAFAIVTGDVAELGQFKTATATGTDAYDLTDTIRGQLGTTAANHVAGNTFVMVSTAQFVPLDIGLAGKTLYFKAVTFGTSQDATEAVPFVFNPLFSSVVVEEYTDDNGFTYTDDAENIYYYEASA